MIWKCLNHWNNVTRYLTRKQIITLGVRVSTAATTGVVIAGKKISCEDKEDLGDDMMADKKPLQHHWYWGFSNPFKEWKEPSLKTLLRWKLGHTNNTNLPSDKKKLDETLPVVTPEFKSSEDGVHVTWIGHATTLVQLDGINILTDPMFGDIAGPGGQVGDKRYRPPACKVADLPEVHAVVISHNHYDHLDAQSVYDLQKRFQDQIHWFVPMHLKSWFKSCGCKKQNIHELNWWQEEELQVHVPGHPDVKFKFALTPAQHWSCRNMVLDKNKTLWGSWCVLGPRHRFYFAGDTGYNSEIFTQIGKEYGPFDLAAIPIGAYLPREIMKPQHVDPAEAVKVHQEIKAKKSVGIHWGTFALAYEHHLAPPKDLKKALKDNKISEEEFFVLKHGESRTV